MIYRLLIRKGGVIMKKRERFITWARKDENDPTPLKITLKTKSGEKLHFSTDKPVSYSEMYRIQDAWIESIELKNGFWVCKLYED